MSCFFGHFFYVRIWIFSFLILFESTWKKQLSYEATTGRAGHFSGSINNPFKNHNNLCNTGTALLTNWAMKPQLKEQVNLVGPLIPLWGVQWLLRPSLYRGVNNEVIKKLYNLSNCRRAAWKKAYNIVENFQNKHLWNFVVIFIFTLLSVKLESYFISSVYWAMRWWFHLIVILSSKLCKYRPIETL